MHHLLKQVPGPLLDLISRAGLGRCYLGGGCVRDLLLGASVKDFDIEVYGLSYEDLAAKLVPHGRLNYVGRTFGVLKFRLGEEELDFTIPRSDSKSGSGHKGFQVAFDPAVFQVMQVEEGGFFKQKNGTTSFSHNVDTANGKLFVSISRADVDGASGEDAVVVVILRALAPSTQTTLKILSASPIVQSDKLPITILPPPYGVEISK